MEQIFATAKIIATSTHRTWPINYLPIVASPPKKAAKWIHSDSIRPGRATSVKEVKPFDTLWHHEITGDESFTRFNLSPNYIQ